MKKYYFWPGIDIDEREDVWYPENKRYTNSKKTKTGSHEHHSSQKVRNFV